MTDPARPYGGIEVTRGRVLLRFKHHTGTVTAEVADPPHPPAGELGTVAPVGPRKPERTPHVTVSLDALGKPHVEIRHGKAVVRILDR